MSKTNIMKLTFTLLSTLLLTSLAALHAAETPIANVVVNPGPQYADDAPAGRASQALSGGAQGASVGDVV